MSVTVKSASGLEKTSRLSMSKRNFNFVAYHFEEGWFSWSVLDPERGYFPHGHGYHSSSGNGQGIKNTARSGKSQGILV